jgi:hypothetical protein
VREIIFFLSADGNKLSQLNKCILAAGFGLFGEYYPFA